MMQIWPDVSICSCFSTCNCTGFYFIHSCIRIMYASLTLVSLNIYIYMYMHLRNHLHQLLCRVCAIVISHAPTTIFLLCFIFSLGVQSIYGSHLSSENTWFFFFLFFLTSARINLSLLDKF